MLLLFCSCDHRQHTANKKVERAFYYWKSVFKLSDYEKHQLDSLHITTLYLKCFDVDWNDQLQQPLPVAKIQIPDAGVLQKINLVPVVFISNECIAKIKTEQATQLAKNITVLIDKTVSGNKLKVNEIQIDCDWTGASKETYFGLLKKIKEFNPARKLSVTIRLHQVKYISKSGIPPADCGLLMCYNMGNLKNPATENSIIDPVELKKYTGSLDKYPLPLDVAFSLFDWKVLFRKDGFKGLIQNLPDSLLHESFAIKKNNRYFISKDTVLNGYSFFKDDVLRCESSDYRSVMAAASEINERLIRDSLRVSLFHLDSITLNKYNKDELENIYNCIR